MREFEPQVWEDLRAAATAAMHRAYAPYSGYPVGAAALTADGRTVVGSNVENAAYGVTLCAECGLVSDLARTGGGRLVAFACVDGHGTKLVPCGRCRQLLYEFGGPDLVLDMPGGLAPMTAVLPEAFGPDHLTAYADGTEAADASGAGPTTDMTARPA
ncbi:cytidine deaminase [Brevibacterium litoralis]|uniref:cytidine deaminase n=1 Tax=Brevibacterium litoralis TaxID=3138935 RepID=UPI0032EB6748